MIKISLLIKLQYYIGLFYGLILQQSKLWRSKVNSYIQFLVMAIFCSQIFLIKELFSQLPEGSWPFMLENMFNPIIGLCFSICIFFGLLQLAYGVGAAAIMNSLTSKT